MVGLYDVGPRTAESGTGAARDEKADALKRQQQQTAQRKAGRSTPGTDGRHEGT